MVGARLNNYGRWVRQDGKPSSLRNSMQGRIIRVDKILPKFLTASHFKDLENKDNIVRNSKIKD